MKMQFDGLLARIVRHLPPVHWRVWDLQRRLRLYFSPRYADHPHDWVVINDYDGTLKMKLRRSTYLGSLIYWHGYQSRSELMVLHGLLKPNMTFVDIGANMGEFTLFAAKRLPLGSVHAFEPLPQLYTLLGDNVALNGFTNVHTYNLALSDAPGRLTMYTSTDVVLHGGLNEGLGSLYRDESRSEVAGEVSVSTLDDVLGQVAHIDVIKIDVEGAEVNVLRGGCHLLERDKPAILIEINRNSLIAAGFHPDVLLDELAALGYRFELITVSKRRRLVPLDRAHVPDLCDVLCRWDGSS